MKLQSKVIVAQPIHETGMKLLEENIERVVVSPAHDPDTLAGQLDDSVEAVIVRYNRFPADLIAKAPNLKVIARHGIGVELIDIDYATRHGILVVNTPDAATISVAEHTVCLMMHIGRNILLADREARKGNFAFKDRYFSSDLNGKTLGIVGAGKIGLAVAQICINGFNMKVIAYDPFADKDGLDSRGIKLSATLDDLLPQADYVSLHTPLNAQTKHMIQMDQLRKMKHSAYLVNCGRGALIKEGDLYDALNEGVIAGAGLDVMEMEPPTKDNPLLKLENVVLTPHSSSLTLESKINMAVGAAEQVIRVLRKQTPEYIVNPEALTE